MPNTLVHLCMQTPVSRVLIRDADFKWIAIGCIIPDIPWIMQRIITLAVPGVDLLDLRIYAVIQASLFFCLLFSLALSLLTARPGMVFLLLSLNAFVHLLLDAVQKKWANGVHFLAPFSWKTTSLSLVWPENPVIYGLSALGLVILIVWGVKDGQKKVWMTTRRRQWTAAALLLLLYLVTPFFLFAGPEKENNHYVATLRDTGSREGKYIEFDRRSFRRSDMTIHSYSGERLRLQGNVPDHDALLSIRGSFMDQFTIEVEEYHRHRQFRDLASMLALSGILITWLLALRGKTVAFAGKQR